MHTNNLVIERLITIMSVNNFTSTTLKLYHKKSSCDHQPCILQNKQGKLTKIGTTAKPFSTTKKKEKKKIVDLL